MWKKLTVCFLTLMVLLPNFAKAETTEETSWQEETIYFLVIDRFNNGEPKNDKDSQIGSENGYYGGDFIGITKQLSYIQELGFTSVGISPVFQTGYDGYKGKTVQDYYEVDEHFGTVEEFQEMVKKAHKLNMKVILDVPYVEANAEEYIDLLSYWVEKTKVDGLRFYEINKNTDEFWTEVIEALKEKNEDLFVIGEKQTEATTESAAFDATFNQNYQEQVADVFSKPDQSLTPFLNVLENNIEDKQSSSIIYLDSRETDRYVRYSLKENYYPEKRLKLALGALLTSPGIPAVYYGTEDGLNGEKGIDNQRIMNFKAKEEMIEHIQMLQELRSNYKVLTHGTYDVLHEKDGFAVIKREYENETFIIAINNTSEDQNVVLTEEQLPADLELRGLFTDDAVKFDDGYNVVISRETVNIFALGEERGINFTFIFTIIAIDVLFVIFLYIVWKKGKKKQKKA